MMQLIGGASTFRKWKCETYNTHTHPLSQCFIIISVPHSKDVRLPREMQRAMAAEAEATREASAKVSTQTTLKIDAIQL